MSRSKIITSTLLIVTFFNPKELSSLRYALITLITLWTQMITMAYGQQRILGGGVGIRSSLTAALTVKPTRQEETLYFVPMARELRWTELRTFSLEQKPSRIENTHISVYTRGLMGLTDRKTQNFSYVL